MIPYKYKIQKYNKKILLLQQTGGDDIIYNTVKLNVCTSQDNNEFNMISDLTNIYEDMIIEINWSDDINVNKTLKTIIPPRFLSSNNIIKSLKIIDNTNSITHIGDYFMYECKNLTNILLSNSITHIGKYFMYDCQSLTNILL